MPVSTAEEIQLESLTTALNELSKPLLASDTLSADSYTDQLEGAVRIAFAPCSSTVLESLHLYGHEHLYRYRSLEKNPASNDSAKRTDTSTLITAHTHHHDTDRGVSHDDLSDKGAWQWAMAVLDILLAIHCTLLKSKTGHAVSGNSPVSLANARATVESFDVTKRSDPNAVQFGANSANDNGNGDNRESALKQSSVMPKSFIEEITSDTTSMSQPGASIPRTKLLIEEISSDKTPVKRPDAAPPSHATDNKDAGALSLSQSMSVRKAIRVLVYAVLVPLLDSELATSLQHYLPQTVAEVALHKKRTSKKEQQKASARARPLTSPVYNFLYLLAAKHESGNWIARTGREEKLAVVVKRIAVWLGAKQGDTTEVTYLTAMHFAYPVLLSALQLAYGGADPTSTSSKDDCIGLDTTTADRSDDLNPRIKIGQKRKQDFAHLLVVLRHRMPLNVVMEAFAQLLALRDLPSSLQPVCSRILTKCLMMQNGVLCLLTHLLSSCETVSDVTAAATQTMRLVINCPRWMAKSKDAYYANICTQLYHLLHLRSSDSSVLNSVSNISRRLPHAVMILIHGMILKHPILARKHLISRMCAAFDVRFVEAGSEPYRPTLSGTQSTPSWVSELRIPVSDIWQCINQDAHTEEVGSSVNTAFITTWDPIVIEQAIQFAVEDMHKVFVAGLSASGDLNGREKSDMLGAVRSYIPILLALFSFTAEYPGVSLSTAVNELVGKILSAIDEDDAVEALFTFLDPGARPDTADVESKQDVHTTFELMSGSRNGVSYRWMPQTERNFAHDCQCVINLLGTLKRTALAGEFFVRLVEALGQVADETDEAGRDIAAASTGNFLHGGGGLSDAEIDRKRSYLLLSQCLGQLVQSLDVSVIKRTRHVIVFAKLLATSADDETTCMALGLLTTILTGNAVTVSKDDEADIAELRGWLEPFANHPNEEIAEIALDLITNIQTRNPLWQELQEQTTNIQTVDHHNSTKPEVSIDASGSGSSSQKAQITDIGNETKSLDNDMGLLPPSKNANSGTNDDAQPSAALVTEYESFSTAMLQLKDPMLPVRAHALVLLRRLLERRDESVRGKEQVILDILVTQIRQLDSYIYLVGKWSES
ncbi:hypothetical protein, variant [Sphaeroforma arctica JP610]|uniref:Uncharacterized protein n=1 Tax=Sphaeroforma arctica JP610 TaxID=667725 RepID=A0A0L0G1N9_9EUKA|nr:hypothetical protein, variant [Sphaeroforma arctica JP610]KNC82736.1 hypothetical protein, variant [Sphaeroforma arctica JP610]|eukprot:XP_014156639.1 hypothetical protein, variant [Sphaeroforma arctica JP610]